MINFPGQHDPSRFVQGQNNNYSGNNAMPFRTPEEQQAMAQQRAMAQQMRQPPGGGGPQQKQGWKDVVPENYKQMAKPDQYLAKMTAKRQLNDAKPRNTYHQANYDRHMARQDERGSVQRVYQKKMAQALKHQTNHAGKPR